ncbi:periplasmic binding protein-like II [Aspergillus steynii IBT 23096]|uniref:Periplasmic binding protein-like II n=1 Tax=Aspergillus steynii IBT 23096 TaxID=1392250 RepID=A0A2I2GRF6_9EURO|nr:periplasmic binding protein-like II [Aspergillus steynii IBT 23096]PLB55466.1 periplasmic binding protein-like II [Aspergillus steynii IBT 23096]
MKAAFSVLGFLGLAAAALPEWNSYPGHSPAVENRTLDEIYAAAKKEQGSLVVLWGGDAVSQGESTIKAWKARFPDIELNLTVDVSKYHDSRVNRQFQRTGSDGADIAVLQTVHDYVRWKKEGRLYPYKPAHWEDVWADIRDPDGAFIGTFIYGFGTLIYNPALLDESAVPSTYEEFTRPEWKSKLVLTYPNDDDAVLYLFSIIINQYGWEWFDALLQQDVKWVRGTGEPAAEIARKQSTRSLSFTTSPRGNLSTSDPKDTHVYWPQTGAIFATTPRPESAKLFMSWLLSDEHQKTFNGSYLARKDLSSTAGSVWEDPASPLTRFSTFMENRETVEWWKLQFETEIGTAQGDISLLRGN